MEGKRRSLERGRDGGTEGGREGGRGGVKGRGVWRENKLILGIHMHAPTTRDTRALTTDMVNLERCSKCLAMSVASTKSMMELLKVRYVVLCVCVCVCV